MTDTGCDLVTGGGGYLGSHLAKALLERGREVRILDVQRTARCPEAAELHLGDIRDPGVVARALDGVERVFHLAFVQSLSKRPEAERRAINIGGTGALLEGSREAGVRRFVFTSTIEIYGTSPPQPCTEDAPTDAPVGWYGRHKLECERMALAFGRETGLRVSAVRMPTICGPGFFNHRPLLGLMERILAGKAVAVVGDGSTPGDFVHVDDVLQGYLLTGEREEAAGEAFNISAKASATQLELIEAMREAVGSRSPIRRVPAALARVGLTLGRLVRIHDLPAYQDGYLFHPNAYAIDKARRLLGYDPRYTTAEAGAELIRGYRAERESVRARSVAY